MSSNFALWWSPDSTHLAYLRLDETKVPEFHLQLYTDRNASYPKENSIRYPKAGSPNPLVSLHVYSLKSNATIVATTTADQTNSASIMDTSDFKDFKPSDRLIIDVAWATTSHTHLLFKQTNRIQDQQLTNIVSIHDDIKKSTVKLVNEYKPTDGGWIDVSQSMVYLPSSNKSRVIRYLDILDNSDGFAHLAIVTVNGETVWLTSGAWEVVSGTVEVDSQRQLV